MKNLYTYLCLMMMGSFLHAQIVNIPDVNFKNALIEEGVDTNGDGEIQISEAAAVIKLIVSGRDISSLEGIESFVNIEELNCGSNNLVTLNMSQNLNLQKLTCIFNQLTHLDVTQNLNLTFLWCQDNQLSDLDVSQNLNLDWLWCSYNQLSSIDVTKNLNLQKMDCGNNPVTELDISQNSSLKVLSCDNNQLNNLDVSQNMNLEAIYCSYNQLNILELSANTKLRELICSDNQLTGLNIANGNNHNMVTMISWGNPDLLCIQVDDESVSRPECDGLPVEGWCKDEWTSYSEDCKLGVDDIKNLGFKLYPNPVKDIMILESDAEIINLAVKIFSLEGRLLSTQNLEFEKQTSLDVSRLSNGIYLLQITSEGKQITYKFLKE